MDPLTGAPEDYAEMWSAYRSHAAAIVSSLGVRFEDVDDVVSDIFCRYMERGDLEKYRFYNVDHPEKGAEMGWRAASFKTYFGHFVALSVRSRRDKLARLRKREMSTDVDVMAASAAEGFIVASPETSIVTALAGAEVLERAMGLCEAKQARLRKRSWTLPEALAVCAESVSLEGKINRAWVGERLGISVSTVATVIAELAEVLTLAGGRELLADGDGLEAVA